MQMIAKFGAMPLALFALACGGQQKDRAANGADDALQKDLALASSPTLELASSAQSYQRTLVVAPIERTTGNVPQRGTSTAKAAAPHHKRTTPAPKPAVDPIVTRAPAPEPAPVPTEVVATAPEPTPDPAEPTAAPRPAPPTVIYPRGDDGDRGLGGLGGIIGVVIRGGDVDGDHCEPRGAGRRGGIAINNRLPTTVSMPMPRTFPHPSIPGPRW